MPCTSARTGLQVAAPVAVLVVLSSCALEPPRRSALVSGSSVVLSEAQISAASAPTAVIVMGVSGSGKSTVGAMLASRLNWRFEDGDWFHPPANVEKMHKGIPLTDDDRWPWFLNPVEASAFLGPTQHGGGAIILKSRTGAAP